MGSLFGGPGSVEKQRDQDISSIVGDFRSDAATSNKHGRKLLKKGSKGVKEGMDFYRNLLEGDRADLSQVLSPELTSTGEAYDQATKNIVEQGPRGAATSDSIGHILSAKAEDLGNIITKARPGAADKVAGIGSVLANLGISEKAMGASELDQAIRALLGLNQEAQQARGDKAQAWGSLLGGVGAFLPTKWFGGGRS